MNINKNDINKINNIINNNIIIKFNYKTNFKKYKNININFYNIINNIKYIKNYIRLYIFKFFINTIYNKANINLFIFYYFKYYENFKILINLYIKLQLLIINKNLIYIF